MDRYVDEDYKTAISHVGIPMTDAYGIISPSEIWEPEKVTKWILRVTRGEGIIIIRVGGSLECNLLWYLGY